MGVYETKNFDDALFIAINNEIKYSSVFTVTGDESFSQM